MRQLGYNFAKNLPIEERPRTDGTIPDDGVEGGERHVVRNYVRERVQGCHLC